MIDPGLTANPKKMVVVVKFVEFLNLISRRTHRGIGQHQAELKGRKLKPRMIAIKFTRETKYSVRKRDRERDIICILVLLAE